jgi:hypothetical protein
MENLTREKLLNLSYDDYRAVFNKYYNELLTTKYLTDPKIKWTEDPSTINVISIRCNDLFVTNDMVYDNDFLIVLENKPKEEAIIYVFITTIDPKTRRNNIANILYQFYFGNIRNHRGIPGRSAICQDFCTVWVRRFTKSISNSSNWLFIDEKGYFGIHIHDKNGCYNSSLGCTILDSQDAYTKYFKPLLDNIKHSHPQNIPVMVIHEQKFKEFLHG